MILYALLRERRSEQHVSLQVEELSDDKFLVRWLRRSEFRSADQRLYGRSCSGVTSACALSVLFSLQMVFAFCFGDGGPETLALPFVLSSLDKLCVQHGRRRSGKKDSGKLCVRACARRVRAAMVFASCQTSFCFCNGFCLLFCSRGG